MSPSNAHRWRAALGRSIAPVSFAALLWLLDRRPAAVISLVAAGVVLLLGLLVPRAAARFDDALRGGALAVGRGLSWVLSTLSWVIVVLPVWALSRLVGYSPLESGWASDRSAWNAADLGGRRDPLTRPTGAHRSGSPDADLGPRQRRQLMARRSVVVAVVLVALTATFMDARGLLGDGGTAADNSTPAGTIDFRSNGATDGPVTFAGLPVDGYAHEDEPFAIDLFREIGAVGGLLRPDSVLGVRTTDFRGEHVNVVDGRRVSYTPEDPTLDVWFFGGSTMFGIGQRDAHTIPSVVARLAEADGIRIRATNFGVNGDVNWQETIRFAEALGTDLPEPDLVVFYDGWNDESVGQYRAEIGSLDPAVSERLPFSDLDREREGVILGERERLGPNRERVELGIQLSAVQYGRGVRTARALGASRDIGVVHFWQPIAAVKRYSASDDELLRRTGMDARFRTQRVGEYARIRELSGVEPVDLSTSLDGAERPIYIDQGHTNELGARIVAGAMYAELLPRLRELADE